MRSRESDDAQQGVAVPRESAPGFETTTVDHCPRCGQSHELTKRSFAFVAAPPLSASGRYQFWAACPATGDPILFDRLPGDPVESEA